jgi:hypothetical protein
MLIFLIILVLYLGWGVYLVIIDFTSNNNPPMYVLNFKEGSDKIFSIIISLIKIVLWPIIYIVKFF